MPGTNHPARRVGSARVRAVRCQPPPRIRRRGGLQADSGLASAPLDQLPPRRNEAHVVQAGSIKAAHEFAS